MKKAPESMCSPALFRFIRRQVVVAGGATSGVALRRGLTNCGGLGDPRVAAVVDPVGISNLPVLEEQILVGREASPVGCDFLIGLRRNGWVYSLSPLVHIDGQPVNGSIFRLEGAALRYSRHVEVANCDVRIPEVRIDLKCFSETRTRIGQPSHLLWC